MKKILFALIAAAALGNAIAAEPTPATAKPAPAIQVQPAPAPAPAPMTPEEFDKNKTRLLEMHANGLKALTEGERCIKGAKVEADLQKCLVAERAAFMPKPPVGAKGPAVQAQPAK